MLYLEGLLSTLSPRAAESLKVITFFDALVDGRAGVEALLRGAARLTGCAAGFSDGTPTGTVRVSASGSRTETTSDLNHSPARPHRTVGRDEYSRIWIERDGALHINDDMVLERLALAVDISRERRAAPRPRLALETLLDGSTALSDRIHAAQRLHLDPDDRIRVTACPAQRHARPAARSIVMLTQAGLVRASIEESTPSAPAGIGIPVPAVDAHRSWESALTALRLTSPRQLVIPAEDLGGLLALAEVESDVADVTAIELLVTTESWAVETLDSLVNIDSLRAAAKELLIHHSTMQYRTRSISHQLGYDIRSPQGRTRLVIAMTLFRLRHTQFPPV